MITKLGWLGLAACAGPKDTDETGPPGPTGCAAIASDAQTTTVLAEDGVVIGTDHAATVAADCTVHVVGRLLPEGSDAYGLRAAVVTHAGVTTEDLPFEDDIQDQVDLALGPSGERHVVYARSAAGGTLTYAAEGDAGWDRVEIGRGAGDSGFGGWNALAVGPDGVAHVAWQYGGYAFGTLAEGMFTGVWSDAVSLDVDVAIGGDGRPVFAGHTMESDVLVARRDDVGFTELGTVDDLGGNTGFDVTMAVDGDVVHVLYYTLLGSVQDVRYATNASGAWVAETVALGPQIALGGVIALDGDGQPVVAYGDTTTESMLLVTRDGAGWATREVASWGDCGSSDTWLDVDAYAGRATLDVVDDIVFLTWFARGAVCLTTAPL
jgi:hypothetical protein